ncbi:MAG: putative HxlR family transcriptional regulator [Frankiales bacterium]|nr:putative HxlR family transcriptional regulator [Frankiales bacterium]
MSHRQEQEAVATLTGGLADREAWSAQGQCSIERALAVVGTRSALLVMREAYYGTRRFDDFAKRIGISEAVAALRLRELVHAGLLERHPYREPGQRTRDEYVLTAMGRDLLPAVLALMRWGDHYLTGPSGGPLVLTHAGCGSPVEVAVRCESGHDVPLNEIGIAPSPAAVPSAPRVPTGDVV